MADDETYKGTFYGEAVGLVMRLFETMEAEPEVQWHRDHDKRHDLYLRTKRFLDTHTEKGA
jgi:hypothetical protein